VFPELPKIFPKIHGLEIDPPGAFIQMEAPPYQRFSIGPSDLSFSRPRREDPEGSLFPTPEIEGSQGGGKILPIEHHPGYPELSLLFHGTPFFEKGQRSLW
jgi:hypothetical protein